ncbi:hypothetical protein T484DRAFT_1606348, partial [Baffinella frigidus]
CFVGYGSPVGNQTCVACDIGQYKDTEGMTPCLPCREHSTTVDNASTSSTSCDCLTGYEGVECTACPDGFFKSVTGSGPCIACGAGMMTTGTAASTCECMEFYVSGDTDVTFCQLCPMGKYYDNTDICAQCPANSNTTSSGATGIWVCVCDGGYGKKNSACHLCESGKFSLVQYCMECGGVNATSAPGSSDISDCVCGMGASGPSCSKCALHTYKNFTGSDPC